MESKSFFTLNFSQLNFNLKRIVFSFLEPEDQRKIYWSNKALRPLLSNSSLTINIKSLKKRSSFQLDDNMRDMLELSDGNIACWTSEGIYVFKYYMENSSSTYSLKVVKKIPCLILSFYMYLFPIHHNSNIIFTDGFKDLKIFDEDFNCIEILQVHDFIRSVCNISHSSFAVGSYDGCIIIYTRKDDSQKYQVKIHKLHRDTVYSLLYLPKYDLLLSGSSDKTINVFEMSNEKSIRSLTNHNHFITSLILMKNDNGFASASYDGEIKFWSITEEDLKLNKIGIECIMTIKAYENKCSVRLHLLGEKHLVSYQENKENNEFKIWNSNSYELVKKYNQESRFGKLIVCKNNSIFIATCDKFLNFLKVSE